MIIAILTWLFRKYALPALARHRAVKTLKLKGAAMAVLLLLMISALTQEQVTKYNVLHSGKVVGRFRTATASVLK